MNEEALKQLNDLMIEALKQQMTLEQFELLMRKLMLAREFVQSNT